MSTTVDPATLNQLTQEVRHVIRREPVLCSPSDSIQAVAQRMSEVQVSSALLIQDQRLMGIVTDRDLRKRVIAAALDVRGPISAVATLSPMTLTPQTPVFQALMLMARHNIHHLPIADGADIVGVVTATSLNEQLSASPVFLAGEIYQQTTVEGLAQVTAKVLQLVRILVESDASAYSVGHIVTSITDALTIRLLQLAHAELGEPPVPYVWVAAGSQARSEQTAKSDQDNCMIIDDAFDPNLHGDYFARLSRWVCDGLDACGYVYCPGDMMAMTDSWRLPLREWQRLFNHWIVQPEPKALMYTSVFFDLRAIAGDASLLNRLRSEIIAVAQKNGIFLSHLVRNALQHRPPLGLFGNLQTERNSEHRKTIDIKHKGLVTIVDLARVYALATGVDAVNTHDRLLAVADHGAVSSHSAHDLRDALEFIAKTRLQHQARQISAGQSPDNFVPPTELSDFEREHLRHAFRMVAKLQEVLAQRYQANR
jgi:CBS domain-containing protein